MWRKEVWRVKYEFGMIPVVFLEVQNISRGL
jgi:hypothetical protein